MAGVRLEFAQFGHFDYFNIYRNSVSTAIENLEQPIGTSSTMYYEDFNTEPNLDYFYRVGVVNGQTEIISDEILVNTYNIPNYRYLRIFINENNGASVVAMQEIEIASELKGADITTPGTPAHQSSYWPNNAAFRLVDNNFSDFAVNVWSSAEVVPLFPQWVLFDLTTATDFVELRIWPQNWSLANVRAPKDFVVQGSNDGVIWDDIKSFSNIASWSAGVGKTFNLITGAVT